MPSLPHRTHLPWQAASWESELFLCDSKQFFESLLQDIHHAQHSVALATYIFQNDILGERVIAALIAAKQRNVEVKVLFDGFGSWHDAKAIAVELEQHGIEVKIFHPLPWDLANHHRALRQGTWVGNLIFYLLKVNQRHHAKICLVDDRILWCGSLNITADHLTIGDGGRGFHDYGTRTSGVAVEGVAEAFAGFWVQKRPRLGRGLFKYYWTNVSALARRKKNKMIIEKLKQAQDRIWIINPYFSPPHSIIRALRRSADRGADVRIIVPKKSDVGFFPVLTSTYYHELLKHGIRVYEYLPNILHAKLLIADDFFLLGSTNFNHRSMLHDLEFDIVLSAADSTQNAVDQFREDLTQSQEITVNDLKLMGFRRFWGSILWLLRYWL